MPTTIDKLQAIQAGDIYEDSYAHPCLCVELNGQEVKGVSLVDGSYPRVEDLTYHTIRKLTVDEARHWRLFGPNDKEIDLSARWWERDKPAYLTNPASGLDNLFFFALYQVEWSPVIQAHIGNPILHQWHQLQTRIEEQDGEGRAEIQFTVKGGHEEARVNVIAFKSNNDWLIDQLTVNVNGANIVIIEHGDGIDNAVSGLG